MKRKSWTVIVILAAYVVAYAALVQPKPIMRLTSSGQVPERIADYRFGGLLARRVFTPLEFADKQLRRDYWQVTPTEREELERENRPVGRNLEGSPGPSQIEIPQISK